jgi:hypothetical protein
VAPVRFYLDEPHRAPQFGAFPNDAVVSLVIPLATGEIVETAMTGRDGVIGAGASLNGSVSFNRAVVQIAGQSLSYGLVNKRGRGPIVR